MLKRLFAVLFSVAVLMTVNAQDLLKVRLGFNPTQNSDTLSVTAQEIADYLETSFAGQIEVEVFLPTEYRGLIEAMRSDNLDFAFFPPDGFVIAQREANAQVLLKSVRFGNPYYWSAIIVRKDSGISSIADLEDKSMAWVDPNSAAGYVFPRSEIILAGIDPDSFFSEQTFAGAHDAAVLSVLNGSVDAAATFANDDQNISGAWTQFLDADQAAELTSIFYSRPIPGDTFSVSKEFADAHPALTLQVAAAIASIPQGTLLTDLYRIDSMILADSSDYDVVREARAVLGLDE
ncbi:MAG: phosphate/phosphite/phosphonate ABC transporter substrate-binding protein [Trueperaceae bacterium]|nr:phosphate/phosphite/phosphonate ABC transporter substrate-binding protein [Trueperaceae bacterium]